MLRGSRSRRRWQSRVVKSRDLTFAFGKISHRLEQSHACRAGLGHACNLSAPYSDDDDDHVYRVMMMIIIIIIIIIITQLGEDDDHVVRLLVTLVSLSWL
jgi:hypothetical protein